MFTKDIKHNRGTGTHCELEQSHYAAADMFGPKYFSSEDMYTLSEEFLCCETKVSLSPETSAGLRIRPVRYAPCYSVVSARRDRHG